MCEHGKVTIRDFKNSDLAEVRDLIKKTIDVCYSNVYCAEAVKFFKDWLTTKRFYKTPKKDSQSFWSRTAE